MYKSDYKEKMQAHRRTIMDTLRTMARDRKRYKLNTAIEKSNARLSKLSPYSVGRRTIFVTVVPGNSYNIPVRIQ